MSEIDHEYTGEIVCPYCGYEFSDSCEFQENDGDIECDCGKTFEYRRIITVEYCTSKNCELNGEEHDFQPSKDSQYVETCSKCDQAIKRGSRG